MKEDVDLRTAQGGFVYANIGRMIGKPLTDERVFRAYASMIGDERPFRKGDNNKRYIDVLQDMRSATWGILCLLRQDINGNWIGRCKACIERLGYDCPGATFLRDKNKQFATKLSTLRKVNANARGEVLKAANKGNLSEKYISGLSTNGRKIREMPPALTSLHAYVLTLRKDQLLSVVEYLELVWVEHDDKTSKKATDMTIDQLLAVLKTFMDSPLGSASVNRL